MATKDDRYRSFMDRFMAGDAPSEDEFLFHFEHQKGDPKDTLAIGAIAPDIRLMDQHGETRSLDTLMGEKGLLVVFARSAYWCPYCRNQLAELNVQQARMRAAGYNIVAITPDVPKRIQDFCSANGIDYPILSDPEAEAISAYKVRNDDIPPNDLQGSAPLPHPGHYLISRARKVIAKEFTGDIRHRLSGATLIAEVAETGAAGVTLSSDLLSATITPSASEVYGGQVIAIRMTIAVADGVHIYGPEVAAPYTPFSLAFEEGALLASQQFAYPDAQVTDLPAAGERLPIMEGNFDVTGRLTLRWSPPPSPFAKLREYTRKLAIMPGEHRLQGTLRFQACSDTQCYPPQAISFELPITVMPNASAGVPVRLGDQELPPPNF